MCFPTLDLNFNLKEALYHGPELWDRLIVIIEQGVIAITAFDAINKMIDSKAKL
jgi:hypothetical protein